MVMITGIGSVLVGGVFGDIEHNALDGHVGRICLVRTYRRRRPDRHGSITSAAEKMKIKKRKGAASVYGPSCLASLSGVMGSPGGGDDSCTFGFSGCPSQGLPPV